MNKHISACQAMPASFEKAETLNGILLVLLLSTQAASLANEELRPSPDIKRHRASPKASLVARRVPVGRTSSPLPVLVLLLLSKTNAQQLPNRLRMASWCWPMVAVHMGDSLLSGCEIAFGKRTFTHEVYMASDAHAHARSMPLLRMSQGTPEIVVSSKMLAACYLGVNLLVKNAY